MGESDIGSTGLIRDASSGSDTSSVETGDSGAKTTWTAGGAAGTAAGEWTGAMWNDGDDGVPDIVTGTFTAELGTDARMAGAFGADHVATP